MYACIYILVLIFSAFVVTIFFSFMFFIKHINKKKLRENNGIDNHKKYKEFIQGNFLVE